jgi:hypothetical protein
MTVVVYRSLVKECSVGSDGLIRSVGNRAALNKIAEMLARMSETSMYLFQRGRKEAQL